MYKSKRRKRSFADALCITISERGKFIMKMVRNMVLAIIIGVIAGLATSVFSYYVSHRDKGVKNTLLAVTNSAQRIRDVYSDEAAKKYDLELNDELLVGGKVSGASGEYIDENVPALSESVMAAFNDLIGEGEENSIVNKVGSVFEKNNGSSDVISVNESIKADNPYGDILRFHVRANSDSEKDQELKIAVKDDVIAMLKPLLADCKSVSESKAVIVSNLQNIYMTAVNTITEEGYDYPVKVYVTAEKFPAKMYGDLTFPEGNYQALRIDIGNALGKNWWCVMYPPLCFIDDATVVVSDKGKKILKDNLSDEEYRALFNDNSTKIKAESAIYNKLKEVFYGF